MTSPSDHDAPSTEIALRDEVAELRAELEQIRATPPVATRGPVGPLDEWVHVIRDYNLLGQSLARTNFVPDSFQGKPDQITAAMMYGREIGIPPVTTLQNMHVIKGKVGMYAEQLRAMILAAGHEYEIDETTSDRCVMQARRKGSERWHTFEYTMDQAKRSGDFAKNDMYQKRPKEMLFARCSGVMAHSLFPDVIRGMGTIEELESVDDAETPPAAPEVTSKGTVQRKTKPKAAAAIEPAKPTAPPTAPDQPALPPLPGEAEPPTAITDPPKRRTETEVLSGPGSAGTSGEGPASAPEDIPSEPADPTDGNTARQCPNISNGEQCRYASGHKGPHTYGGGLKDPVSNRHCGHADEHEPHAWSPKAGEVYNCSGAELAGRPERDGFPDDLDQPVPPVQETEIPDREMLVRHCPDFDNSHEKHIWQLDGDDVNYLCSGMLSMSVKGTSGALPSAPKPMTAAQTKLLQSRFRALGYTDDPGDREARLAIAAVLAGRDEVTTFRAGQEDSMTSVEASRVIDGLADCRNRDDVLELMVKAKQDADAEETQA